MEDEEDGSFRRLNPANRQEQRFNDHLRVGDAYNPTWGTPTVDPQAYIQQSDTFLSPDPSARLNDSNPHRHASPYILSQWPHQPDVAAGDQQMTYDTESPRLIRYYPHPEQNPSYSETSQVPIPEVRTPHDEPLSIMTPGSRSDSEMVGYWSTTMTPEVRRGYRLSSLSYPLDRLHSEEEMLHSVSLSPNFGTSGPPRALEVATIRNEFPGCHILYPTGDFEPIMAGGSEATPSASTEAIALQGLRPKQKRARKAPDPQEREEIKIKRQTGVCLRCKMFKEKCRGEYPCERCDKLKLWKFLCVPAQLIGKVEAKLQVFDKGRVDRYKNLLKEIPAEVVQWPSSSVEIHIGNGYPPNLMLEVHGFNPGYPISRHIPWRDFHSSNFTLYSSTNYGLKSDISIPRLEAYIDSLIPYLNQEVNGDNPYSTLHIHTMNAAANYATCQAPLSTLVRQSLRLYTSQIIPFSHPWRLTPSSNTLSMSPLPHLISAHYNNPVVPLPSLIQLKLDTALEYCFSNFEEAILEEIQKLVLSQKKEQKGIQNWFGIYLCIYMFLSALERDMWNCDTWRRWFTQLERSGEGGMMSMKQENDYEEAHLSTAKHPHLAWALVAHFRALTTGVNPFTMNWSDKQTTTMVSDDENTIKYMKYAVDELKRIGPSSEAWMNVTYDGTDFRCFEGCFTAGLLLLERRGEQD